MRPSILASTFLAAAAMAASAWSQQPPPSGSARAAPPIAGGYAPANEADADQKAARKMAIEAVLKKYSGGGDVKSVAARVQVVAGLNYAFHIVLTGGGAYDVVVYRDLQGVMSLTKLSEGKP